MEPQAAVHKLPAGLAGVLNSPDLNRDSAYYSSTDASSKHTSAASCIGVNVVGPPSVSSITSSTAYRSSSSSQPDKTPSPTSVSTNLLPQPLVSPTTSSMSVASIVSPTTPSSGDLRRLADRPLSLDSINNPSGPHGSDYDPMSRRESVDSRINQGFGDLRLGGNSPYASHNHSTTSFHQTQQQAQQQQQQQQSQQQAQQSQRQPRVGLDSLSVHRISNGYQPNAERNPDGQPKIVRTAPAITGPAIGQIARAAEPTKGQAWAFPEEEIQRMPSAASHSLLDSPRSSIADSLASSQYTSESRLPSGQRRFDDPSMIGGGAGGSAVGSIAGSISGSIGGGNGMGGGSAAGGHGPATDSMLDYHSQHQHHHHHHHHQSLGHGSSSSQRHSEDFPTTHHHALQHKQLDDLQSDAGAGSPGSQPYSRTPELRISHKLAERKRRTEMKELFEQLRDLMPQERGSKASKWEILTKAITEHQRLQETVRSVTQHSAALSGDASLLKNELHQLRMENQQLRASLATMQAQAQVASANARAGPDKNGNSMPSDPFSRGAASQHQQSNRPELPPLRSLNGGLLPPTPSSVGGGVSGSGPPLPESMAGVQYDQSRLNGFR